MLKKFINALMALTMVVGVAIASAPNADAHGRGRGVGLGIAAGIIGLGILRAASANARPYRSYSAYDDDVCYRGPRECHWTGRRCFMQRRAVRRRSGYQRMSATSDI